MVKVSPSYTHNKKIYVLSLPYHGPCAKTTLASTLAHVDRGGVERVLEVRSVEFLDHLDARAAVLRDLVDVGAFEEAEADVGVPEAVCGALVAVAIDLKLLRRSRSRRRITMF